MTEDSQLFEAEDFVGTWSVAQDVAGASGRGTVSSQVTGRRASTNMVLRLALSRPGTFHIWTQALAGGGEARSILLRAGRTDLGPTHERKDGPARLAWEKAGQVTWPAGEVFLEIIDAGVGREAVDSIVITRDERWSPPGG
jgi:hypothetical protein